MWREARRKEMDLLKTLEVILWPLPYFCHEPNSARVRPDTFADFPSSFYYHTTEFCFLLCWLFNGAASYSDCITLFRLFMIGREVAVSYSRPYICLHSVRNSIMWLRIICILAEVRTGLLPDARRIFDLLRQLVLSTLPLTRQCLRQ